MSVIMSSASNVVDQLIKFKETDSVGSAAFFPPSSSFAKGEALIALVERKVTQEKGLITGGTEPKPQGIAVIVDEYFKECAAYKERINATLRPHQFYESEQITGWDIVSSFFYSFIDHLHSEDFSIEAFFNNLSEREKFHAIIEDFESRKKIFIDKIQETEEAVEKADGKEEIARLRENLDANSAFLREESEMFRQVQELVHKDRSAILFLSQQIKNILDVERPSDAKFVESLKLAQEEVEGYLEKVDSFNALIQQKRDELDEFLGVRQGILEKLKDNHTFVSCSNFLVINKLYFNFLMDPTTVIKKILDDVRKAKEFAVKNPSQQTKELVRDIQIAIGCIDGDDGIKGMKKQLQQDLIIDALFKGFSREELRKSPKDGIPKEIEETWNMLKAIPFMFQLQKGMKNGSSNPVVKATTAMASLLVSSSLPNFAYTTAFFYFLNTLFGIWEQINFEECKHVDKFFSTQDELQLLEFLDLMQSQYSNTDSLREALQEMRVERMAIDVASGKISRFDSFIDAAKDCFLKIKLAKTWQEKALRIFLQIIAPAAMLFGIVAGGAVALSQLQLTPLYLILVGTATLSGIGTELLGLVFGYMPRVNAYLDRVYPETLTELQNYKAIHKQKEELEEFKRRKEEMINSYIKKHRSSENEMLDEVQMQKLRSNAEKAIDMQIAEEEAALKGKEDSSSALTSSVSKIEMPKGEEMIDKLLKEGQFDEGTVDLVKEHLSTLIRFYDQHIAGSITSEAA